MIQISFTFADRADAKAFIDNLGAQAETVAAVQEALAPQQAPPTAASEAAPKKSPGRPKKEVAAAAATPASATPPENQQTPAAVVTATSPSAPVSTAPAVTHDTIRATAEAVVAKLGSDVGMSRARAVIKDHGGVVTIRDIPADKLAAVNAELLKL